MASSRKLERQDVSWYCCRCPHGEMPEKLVDGCVECGHMKCASCGREPEHHIWPPKVGGDEALHGTHQWISESSTRMGDTTVAEPFLSLSPPSKRASIGTFDSVAQTHPSQSEVTSEIWRNPEPDQSYEGGESTPRTSSPDSLAPFDSILDANRDAGPTVSLFKHQGTSDFQYYFPGHTNTVPTLDQPYPDVGNIPEEKWPNEKGACQFESQSWDTSRNYISSLEPPSMAVEPTCVSHSNQQPALWTDYSSITQYPIHSLQIPSIGDLSHPDEMPSAQYSSLPGPAYYETGHRHQATNKRKLSQDDNEIKHTDRVAGACKICLPTTKLNRGGPLACYFYKRNPSGHPGCRHKEFQEIRTLVQHLKSAHKLREHHCRSCWESFKDRESLEAHSNCQGAGGRPVDELPPIPKHRGDPKKKWYYIWKKLYGEDTPPTCPHPHPEHDLFDPFFQYLVEREVTYVPQLREFFSQWVSDTGAG
ncbi:uncharacterized protein F4822DRAFT_427945 [Hypoxylon trugodes]|uniref:uncharacterized protein n=1 Tax=Hypoxylon trugodes TaxID=326681 RepID=UPI00218F6859|nr:uncharacterized protein F4822DRAFT_427945 [Hypoxylon trugodes]KAI1389600.1 hypothetical protein F4822DRAFT_427945 [Hypoxylon trugodes]